LANVLLLALQLVCFLASLAAIGEHLRRLIASRTPFLDDLDLLQMFVLDIYLGELVLYLLALMPGAFRPEVLIAITILAWLTLMIRLIKRGGLSSVLQEGGASWTRPWEALLAFSLSAYVLGITLYPFTELYLGDISDVWLHGLYARLIMERRCLPTDMAPYGEAPIFYPMGFHVMAVYAAYLFAWNPLLAVAYVCCAFRALAPLAAYAFGRTVDREGRLGLTMALAFGLLSKWPRLTPYWAGPFISGSSLFLTIMAMLARPSEDAREPRTAAFLGLLCGLMFVTYPMFAFTAIISLTYILLRTCWPDLRRLATGLTVSSATCLTVMSYAIKQYLMAGNISTYTPIPGARPDHELLVERTYQSLAGMEEILDRFFWGSWLTHDAPTKAMSFLLMGIALAMAPLLSAQPACRRSRRLLELSLLGIVVNALLTLPCLDEVGLVPLGAVSFEYFFIIFYYELLFLTAILLSAVCRVESISLEPPRKVVLSSRQTGVGLLMLALLIWPFAYYSAAYDGPCYVRHHRYLDMLGPDELAAIEWIHENLPEDALVLVDYWEAGRVIPALAGRRAIPIGRLVYSRLFYNLLNAVAEGYLDPTFYQTVEEFGITHVFVGGRAFPGQPDWKPWVFWGNPNFELLFRRGDAYVFAIVDLNASNAFLEEFEDPCLYSRGWVRRIEGYGDFSETYNYPYSPGRRGLLLTARATRGPYRITLARRIVAWNTASVHFSFYINTTGLGEDDGLRIYVVSEEGLWLAFCGPADELLWSIWSNQVYPILKGTGCYHVELSGLWRQAYGEQLPHAFEIKVELEVWGSEGCWVVLDSFSICLGS